MTYMEEQTRKAVRIAKFLCAHPDKCITRQRLAVRLDNTKDHYTPGIITALWPIVEDRVDALSEGLLFALRPISQYGYRCAATSNPLGIWLSAKQREKHITTRMINDLEDGVNLQRMEHDPRYGRDATRLVVRMEMYLALWREAVSVSALSEEELIAEIMQMEEIR